MAVNFKNLNELTLANILNQKLMLNVLFWTTNCLIWFHPRVQNMEPKCGLKKSAVNRGFGAERLIAAKCAPH
jgi:hypothetical protein